MVLSGLTGASPLHLPFIKPGATTPNPIEIIRRPQPADSAALTQSRLYNRAQIRVLLSDDPAELPGGAADVENIRLGPLMGTEKTNGPAPDKDTDWTKSGFIPPPPAATLNPPAIVDGWLRVEYLDNGGNWVGITDQWLALGFSRQEQIPNSEQNVANTISASAILLFQQPRNNCATPCNNADNWWPINIYDTREGNMRDSGTGCNVGGVINLVDIDVKNLQTWLQAHPNVTEDPNGGYLMYFSDRRGMLINPRTGTKIGEYGFEDVINEASSTGTPSAAPAAADGGAPDPGEDVNGNGVLDAYGGTNLGIGFNAPAGGGIAPNVSVPAGSSLCSVASKNWVSGARHGVRLINGSLGNLPLRKTPSPDPNNTQAFTFASENPVYVSGNFNANNAGFGDPHGAASVIADAVTLLSGAWDDSLSLTNPTAPSLRPAVNGNFRMAICAGKNMNFRRSLVAGTPSSDFGTDGGVQNFLRLLESWNGRTLGYRGSLVSLYYSQYATGVFKCCTSVYQAPVRNFSFDTDFQTFALLPPGTPNFEDVVNVGFRQIFDRR